MSPQKVVDYAGTFMKVGMGIAGFCGVFVVNLMMDMNNKVEIILRNQTGQQEINISTERRVDRVETVINFHASDIQANKIDIRELKTKIERR